MQRPLPDDSLKLDTSIPRLPPPTTPRQSRSRTDISLRTSSPSRSSTYLPFWSSRSSSPQRPASPTESNATFHTVEETQEKRPGVKRLTSWFEGSSEPVNIGLVASAEDCTNSKPIMSSANTSRFSFFRRSSTNLAQYSESLESLSIKDTLFPDGPAEFSPAAYKNLQQNAEGALKLFQHAYRESQISLRKITSEKNVQADEFEAAQMRNDHLKSQLLDMADRATAQEKLIARLQAENDRLNEAHSRTIRLITADDESDRRHRSSDMSCTESIASTDVESIFSHQEVEESVASTCSSPVVKHASPHLRQTAHVGSNSHLNSLSADVRVAVQECTKCRGVSDEAWEVLNIKVAENMALKQYIHEMESATEDAGNLCVWQPIELLDMKKRCGEMVGGQAGLRMLDDDVEQQEERRLSGMKGCIV